LAIINRYGFNSDGLEIVCQNLENYKKNEKSSNKGYLGINLGKNKETKDAELDYILNLKKLTKYADYIVINISSPNTPGLRDLQKKSELYNLLYIIKKELLEITSSNEYISENSVNKNTKYVPPLIIKISPDMTDSELSGEVYTDMCIYVYMYMCKCVYSYIFKFMSIYIYTYIYQYD
jgi:dihydroorotate dehydrogenase